MRTREQRRGEWEEPDAPASPSGCASLNLIACSLADATAARCACWITAGSSLPACRRLSLDFFRKMFSRARSLAGP